MKGERKNPIISDAWLSCWVLSISFTSQLVKEPEIDLVFIPDLSLISYFPPEKPKLWGFKRNVSKIKNKTKKRTSAALQSRLLAVTTWLQVVLSLSSDFPGNRQTLKGCFDRANCLSDQDERLFSSTDIKDDRRDAAAAARPCQSLSRD